ncbi:UNVERIFIED_CONTAM: hypothetical protein FKN15_011577 [Acipenser sinensis]
MYLAGIGINSIPGNHDHQYTNQTLFTSRALPCHTCFFAEDYLVILLIIMNISVLWVLSSD